MAQLKRTDVEIIEDMRIMLRMCIGAFLQPGSGRELMPKRFHDILVSIEEQYPKGSSTREVYDVYIKPIVDSLPSSEVENESEYNHRRPSAIRRRQSEQKEP